MSLHMHCATWVAWNTVQEAALSCCDFQVFCASWTQNAEISKYLALSADATLSRISCALRKYDDISRICVL